MDNPNRSALDVEATAAVRLASLDALLAETDGDAIAALLADAKARGYGCGVGWEMTHGSFYAVTRIPNDAGRLFTVTGEDPALCLTVALRLARHRDAETADGGAMAPFVPPPDLDRDGTTAWTHENTPWR